ncbi:helix-turn-helix domain-containing protein [Streptomyces sp. NPDC058674]|uniref:helix-turn-helix domain-containing protein n=1 Tax=Streptomyces sp. NPDC058674 TaxID=3346592 RepID=UPI003650B7EA
MSQQEAPWSASAYGEALRNVLQRGKDKGATQRAFAGKAGLDAPTLSRYLSGERTAPKRVVEALASYLAHLGLSLSEAEMGELHELRRAAERNSGQSAARIAYWTEEVFLLRRALDEKSQIERSLLERLKKAETELDVLVGDLANALELAQQTEGERDQLETLIAKQHKQLEHAQLYSRQLENDLACSQQAAQLLGQEIRVLREQVRKLLEEQYKKCVIKKVTVPPLRRQPGLTNYLLDPWRAKHTLEYKKVDTFRQQLLQEFKAACRHYKIVNPDRTVEAGRKIAALTDNKHWITVAKNVDHLSSVGCGIYGSSTDAGFAGVDNRPPKTPTIETANAFVAGVDTVLAQIKHLRERSLL